MDRSFAITGSLLLTLSLSVLVSISAGQSSDQGFPTPITRSEIAGRIKARDIGDARLTTYYFAFDGDQGDIFVNVVTKNFDGDIDIFTVEGLRQLSRIKLFADTVESETGRIIYLRKPERLLLRIQGRTPDDSPATYKIKFAGSFIALKAEEKPDEPVVKNLKAGSVNVNSVGTKIERPHVSKPSDTIPSAVPIKRPTDNSADPRPANKKPEVIVTENVRKDEQPTREPVGKKPANPNETVPLTNIRMIILFKDGKRIEKTMSQILRFGYDNGYLTVIFKDGYIGKYSLQLIEKMTVE